MIRLIIQDNIEFKLLFDEYDINKFTMCQLLYLTNNSEMVLKEDYIYIFIENMLGRINKTPILYHENLLGKLGQWQEYYYYKKRYVKKHCEEIKMMESALFLSCEKYGIFLYKYKDRFWMELNRGFYELCKLNPYNFYSDPANYRIFFNSISYERLLDWKMILERYRAFL